MTVDRLSPSLSRTIANRGRRGRKNEGKAWGIDTTVPEHNPGPYVTGGLVSEVELIACDKLSFPLRHVRLLGLFSNAAVYPLPTREIARFRSISLCVCVRMCACHPASFPSPLWHPVATRFALTKGPWPVRFACRSFGLHRQVVCSLRNMTWGSVPRVDVNSKSNIASQNSPASATGNNQRATNREFLPFATDDQYSFHF